MAGTPAWAENGRHACMAENGQHACMAENGQHACMAENSRHACMGSREWLEAARNACVGHEWRTGGMG
eukprot:353706-Chlamydomonas_euryale.AAC.5